jgi:hypothetical protein
MKELTLSKFKKIAEDDKTTTLQHPDGHKIQIAIKSLSPKFREELKRLPKVEGLKKEFREKLPQEHGYTKKPEQKVQRFADGSSEPVQPNYTTVYPDADPSTTTSVTQDMDPESPEPAQPAPPNMPVKPGQKPAVVYDEDKPIEITADKPPLPEEPPQSTTTAQANTTDDSVPITQQGQDVAEPEISPGAQTTQMLNTEDQNLQMDLDKGHITPETFNSMFANKSLPGKIGSIFGMILSGAGSGLSHQTNAFTDMIQKELDRDLDAQKTSASNAQNAYRLTQQQQLNEANIKHMANQDNIAQIQAGIATSKAPWEIKEIISKVQGQGYLNELTKAQAARYSAMTPKEIAKADADIQELGARAGLTQAQTDALVAKTPYDVQAAKEGVKKIQADTNATNATAAINTDSLAQMRHNRFGFATVMKTLDSIPDTIPGPNGTQVPNPKKAEAQNLASILYGKMNDLNSNISTRAGAAAQMVHTLNQSNQPRSQAVPGNGPQPAQPQQQQQGDTDPSAAEEAFGRQQKALRMSGTPELRAIADDNEARHIPGIQSLSSTALDPKDKEQINKSAELVSSLNRLQNFATSMSNVQRLTPAQRNYGNVLAAQVRSAFQKSALGGVFREQEKDFIESVIPDPSSFIPNMTVTPKIKALTDETQAKMSQMLKQNGFSDQNALPQLIQYQHVAQPVEPKKPGSTSSKSGQSAGPKEGDKSTSKGTPIIFKNGKWGPQ